MLEQAIDQLYESFESFSNQISTVVRANGDDTIISSFHDTLKTFVDIAAHRGTQSAVGEENSGTMEEFHDIDLDKMSVSHKSYASSGDITSLASEPLETRLDGKQPRLDIREAGIVKHTSQQATAISQSIYGMPMSNSLTLSFTATRICLSTRRTPATWM